MMKEYLRHKAKGGKTEGGGAWGHSKKVCGGGKKWLDSGDTLTVT